MNLSLFNPLSRKYLLNTLLQWRTISVIAVLIWLIHTSREQWLDDGSLQGLVYSALGLIGAIFANLSGAGGGVVFIPVFAQLGLSESQAVSTSFAIQSFGMTAGALTWCCYYWFQHRNNPKWQSFIAISVVTGCSSAVGLWADQVLVISVPTSLMHVFSWFSIILGLSLLSQIYLLRSRVNSHNRLIYIDYFSLICIGLVGGLITAWLSVGVGELLVLYLIFRGFCVTMSIACAVLVTAMTIWSAAPIHLSSSSDAVWDIASFAGPAAIIGGILAKTIATYINTKTLKTVLGLWILVMGIIG